MIKQYYKKIVSERIRNKIYIIINKLKGILLFGNQFYCVCCNHSFRVFLKKGNGIVSRNNAQCPNCGSLERTRLLYYYLKNETSIFDINNKILHIAPENILKKKFNKNPNYYDADINPDLATYQMDITDIKVGDNTFDYIICSHVLGHVPDEKKALSELYRVLKKNGVLFILCLLDLNRETTYEDSRIETELEKLQNYGEKDLVRLYGNDIINRLSYENISIEKIDYRNNFSDIEKTRFALGNGSRELIFKCTK